MIPEVKKYFSDVEIDIELADQVTEINQGYTEIYGKLIPDWDGEDDAFNIKSAKGIKQFKNLKSVTLFFDHDKSILDEFKKEGINATWV